MPKVHVSRITVGELAVNCWFLVNEDSKEALVFDPGDQAEKIAGFASEQGVKVAAILLTHGHIDHMGGADALRKLTGAKVYALDEFLHDGQELTLAGMKLKVYHTPGHTPGGASYYCAEAGCVFSGDTLFHGSVGRTDFPGGSMSAIVRSLREKLFLLPKETVVYPGHGDETSIGYEEKYNPYA